MNLKKVMVIVNILFLNDFVYVELYRIKEGEYINVPGGALGIRFSLL